MVVVVHGDLRTTYEPVAASIAVGAQVPAGAEIGRLDAGHAGCPAAACLHWGLRGGAYLDPVPAVDRQAGPVAAPWAMPVGLAPGSGPFPGAGPAEGRPAAAGRPAGG